jgi:hypothetical protein
VGLGWGERNAYRILLEKRFGKSPFRKQNEMEGNINTGLEGVGYEGGRQMELAQGCV